MEVLVKEFYMSAFEIALHRDHDISGLVGESGVAALQTPHQKLVDLSVPQEQALLPNPG